MTTLTDFLTAFYPDDAETICLRQLPPKTAPPHILRDGKYLPKNIETARRQLVDKTAMTKALRAANKTHGLYFVVNAGGHDDKSITRFNAFFVEDDSRSIEEQRARLDDAPLPTSIRVVTRKSIHAYWLIDGDVSAEDWQETQERLIAYFEADPVNKNPSRVMRLPFFEHVSYMPADDKLAHKPVTLDQFEPARRYTAEQMLAAFPPAPVKPKSAGKATRQGASPQPHATNKVTTLASVLERQRNGEALNQPVIAPGDYSDGEIEQADAELIENTIERISLQLANAEQGTKDCTLFECGLILYGLVNSQLANEERITATLLNAVALAGQDDPTFDADHARQTARHAYDRATATTLDDLRARERQHVSPAGQFPRNDFTRPTWEQPQHPTQTADTGEADSADKHNLAVSWADFDAEIFPEGERIAFAVERGEIALVNALPNAGKTTLALNAVVSLAAGRRLSPVVDRGKPRRVLYIDGETRRPRLQRDVQKMTKGFDREEAMAVGRNLYVICEAEIKDESLSITRTDHLLRLSLAASRIKPDFIVIDTLSSLCPVFNENDNAEQTRKIWRPLQKLARDCDAAILVLHHVGKRGSEEGQTQERVYRGRGASAAGGAARAVWLLIPDATTPGLSTLSCVKAKGDTPTDVRFQLDPATRWMSAQVIEPQPVVTPLERVLEVVKGEMRAAEIKAALNPHYKERAVEIALSDALQQGKLRLVKKGVYALVENETARTAATAEGDFADDADDAVAPENEPENRQPHQPQPPIGSAVRAVPVSGNKSNNLEPKPQNRQKQPVRLRAVTQKGKPDEPHQPHQPMTRLCPFWY